MFYGRPRKILFVALLLFSLLSLGSAPSAFPESEVSFNHDLIYLNVSTGGLMILPAGQAAPEILAGTSPESRVQVDGSVISYSASDSGHELALVINRPDETYGIIWLSSQTLDMETVGEFSNFPEVKISPNGKWLAYREEDSLEIFAVNVDVPGEKPVVGICNELEILSSTLTCTSFYWSPNSTQLIWSDGVGLWVAQPPVHAKRVINNIILRRDYQDGVDVIGQYRIHSWSPTSRYVVLDRPVFDEGVDRVLLDIQKGKLVEIPNTFEYVTPAVHFNWLDASSLSVVTNSIIPSPPSKVVWIVDPSNPSLIVKASRVYLDYSCTYVYQSGAYAKNGVYYLLLNSNSDLCASQSGQGYLLVISSEQNLASPVEYPFVFGTPYFIWSPDYRFGILSIFNWGTGGSLHTDLYDVEKGTVEDLTSIIGDSEDVCCFTWVE